MKRRPYESYKLVDAFQGNDKAMSIALIALYVYINENPDDSEEIKEAVADLSKICYDIYKNNGRETSNAVIPYPKSNSDEFMLVEINVGKEFAHQFTLEDIADGEVLVRNHYYEEEESL